MPGRWTKRAWCTIQCIKYYTIRLACLPNSSLGTSSSAVRSTLSLSGRRSHRDRQIGSATNFAYNVVHSRIWGSFPSPHAAHTQKATQRNLCKRAKSTCSSIAPVASTDGSSLCAATLVVGTHWVLGALNALYVIDWCVYQALEPAVTAGESGPVPKMIILNCLLVTSSYFLKNDDDDDD